MGDGVQAPVGERGAALQVERGNAAQRRQRAQPIVYERHVAPPVQAQRPACGVAKSSACLAAGSHRQSAALCLTKLHNAQQLSPIQAQSKDIKKTR